MLVSHLEEQPPLGQSYPGKQRERRTYSGTGEQDWLCWSTCHHVAEAASKMKSSIHGFMCLAMRFVYVLVCFDLIKTSSMGLLCITDTKMHLRVRLLLRGSLFRLGAHSAENKKEIEKYTRDKGCPSNYISASLLLS